MAELIIYTASRSLQGAEVRKKFDSTFADLYHDLDMGFSPVNFMLPWFPLPHNRKRDMAREKMIATYSEIIQERRATGTNKEHDMIGHLMQCKYKGGRPVPEHEIAGIMLALLMAGQHSSSATISWMLLRLAQKPHLMDELLEEQKLTLGADLRPLQYDDLANLPLHAQVVKETLRMHAPIHSILRQVKQPLAIPDTRYTVPPTHILLSSPGVSASLPQYFGNPGTWDPHRWDAGSETAAKLAAADEVTAGEGTIDYGWGAVSKGTNSPYLPFGAGRHRCIGEQFAYVQLQTVLAAFVRALKLRGVNGSRDIVETDYSVRRLCALLLRSVSEASSAGRSRRHSLTCLIVSFLSPVVSGGH